MTLEFAVALIIIVVVLLGVILYFVNREGKRLDNLPDLDRTKEKRELEENKDRMVCGERAWEGRYLVSLKKPYRGMPNNLLPAYVEHYRGPTEPRRRLHVVWDNGWEIVEHFEALNICELN